MSAAITTPERESIVRLLADYAARFPAELPTVARVRRLVVEHDDCLLRSCVPGHVTASAWIVAPDRRRCLLTHHAKLDRWLQLGGHVDGDADVARSATREAREESGMERFELWQPVPLDLDVHVIPARASEPAHEHHDFRFLLIAAPGQAIRASDESKDLRWFEPGELASITTDESVIRLARKARAALSATESGLDRRSST